jgi:caffeoyl-CoA O-methyltransferase
MSFKEKAFGQSSPDLAEYVGREFGPEDQVLAEVRERSLAAGLPGIQMGPFDNLHLEILTRAVGAKKAVEIGTLGGYSGISIARGLAPGGKLYTFEYEPKHADVARDSFRRHGFADRVHLHVGAALDNLPKIEGEGPFDLVFIDADKGNYPNYLAWAEQHLRIGGVVLGDNAFAWGQVAKEKPGQDGDAGRAIAAFNHRLAHGGHFRATMLPTAEGLAMGVKIR